MNVSAIGMLGIFYCAKVERRHKVQKKQVFLFILSLSTQIHNTFVMTRCKRNGATLLLKWLLFSLLISTPTYGEEYDYDSDTDETIAQCLSCVRQDEPHCTGKFMLISSRGHTRNFE